MFLLIVAKTKRTMSILFAFPNRPVIDNRIYKKNHSQFQNSQEFALDGGVIFDTLANSNEFHAK